jgi:hypothetical protein
MARALEMAAITTIPTNMGQYGMKRMVSFFTLVVVSSHKFISYTDWYLVILSHGIGLSLLNTIIASYRQSTSAQDHSL